MQRRRFDRVGAYGMVVAAAVAACAGQATQQTRSPATVIHRPSPTQRAEPSPPTARAASQSPDSSPDARVRATLDGEGSAVFFRVCGPCHLAMWRVPPAGSLAPNERSEEEVRRQIRRGSVGARGTMPPIDERTLPEGSMVALIEHLRTIRVVAPRAAN